MRYVILRDGREIPVDITEREGGYRVVLDGVEHLVDSLEVVPGLFSLIVAGSSYEATVHRPGPDIFHVHLYDGMRIVELVHPMAVLLQKMGAGNSGRAGSLAAPMPGKVVRVLVEVGDAVEKGAGLVVLEAMKMQNQLQAPGPGTVREVRVAEGESVDGGQILVVLEPPPERKP
jgi:acetyl/propionyl-CoA carboxylase alpha subunit